MGRQKTLWSRSCNAQVGICFTFVMQWKIGIEPVYHKADYLTNLITTATYVKHT